MSTIRDGGTYTLRCYSGRDEKVLNVFYDGYLGNGVNAVLWDSDGSKEQLWVAEQVGNGLYKLHSKRNESYVLDRNRYTNNADVWRDTASEDAAQIIKFESAGSGTYRIRLSGASLYLRAANDSSGSGSGTSTTANGNVYWTSNSGDSYTRWIVEDVEVGGGSYDKHEPPAAGVYNIVNAGGGNLNVYAGLDRDGTKMVLWEDDGSAEQQFKLANSATFSKMCAMCSANGDGRVLDAYRVSAAVQNGASAQLWTENDPVSQQLTITLKGNGLYKISLNGNNDLALTATGNVNNTSVTYAKFQSSNLRQLWYLQKVDTLNGANDLNEPPATGIYNVINSNGAYLNVYGGADKDGTNVVVWKGDGSADQQFKLVIEGGICKLKAMCSSAGGNRVVDAFRNGPVQNDAKAELWQDNDPTAQHLVITPKGGGLYKIAVNSNKALALTAAGAGDNARVSYKYFKNQREQLWAFEPLNTTDPGTHVPPREGVYSVSFGGLNLNIVNGLNLNCTRAIMWSPDGSPDQKFRLENAADGSRLFAMCSNSGAGKVLDAFRPGAAVEEGATAEIYDSNDDVSQKLRVTPIGGKYKISLQSNPMLSLTASSATANAKVSYQTYTGAANQLWSLGYLGAWEVPEPGNNRIEKIPTANCYPDRNGATPKAWVCHIAEGGYEGTIQWCLNPESGVSPNFVIGKKGQICEMVPVSKGAWCNGTSGDTNNSVYWGHATANVIKEYAPTYINANYFTISIEFEGFYNVTHGALTTAQLDATAWLMQYVQDTYHVNIPFDREHIIGHNQVNPRVRTNCPGELFQYDKLIEMLGGTVTPPPTDPTIPNGNNNLTLNSPYLVKNTGTNTHLTVENSQAIAGANVCHEMLTSGAKKQIWKIASLGIGKVLRLCSYLDLTLALDYYKGSQNLGNADLWQFSDRDQDCDIIITDCGGSKFKISRNRDKTIALTAKADGNVKWEADQGLASQFWTFTSTTVTEPPVSGITGENNLSERLYTLGCVQSGKYLTLSGDSATDGAATSTETALSGWQRRKQIWALKKKSAGNLCTLNLLLDQTMALDFYAAADSQYGKADIWRAANQYAACNLLITEMDRNSYKVTNTQDKTRALTDTGSGVKWMTDTDAANQRWTFTTAIEPTEPAPEPDVTPPANANQRNVKFPNGVIETYSKYSGFENGLFESDLNGGRAIAEILAGFYRYVFGVGDQLAPMPALDPRETVSNNCLYYLYGELDGGKYHQGTDMNFNVQSHPSVRSFHDGIMVGVGGTYGIAAIYDIERGMLYNYLHMDIKRTEDYPNNENAWAVGDIVHKGDVLGNESTVGAGGPHLHFEARKAETAGLTPDRDYKTNPPPLDSVGPRATPTDPSVKPNTEIPYSYMR